MSPWPEKRSGDGRPTLRLGLACVSHGEFVKLAVLLQLHRDRGRAHWQLTLDADADVRLEHPSCSAARQEGRRPVRVLMVEEGEVHAPANAAAARFVLRTPLMMHAFFEMLDEAETVLLGPATPLKCA